MPLQFEAHWCSWLTRRPLKAEIASSSLACAITTSSSTTWSNIMKTSGARKSAFLGMSRGTAVNRLRKMVMFHLLQKHGENVCFKCSKIIESADELSIEHKQPWENISVEPFWSLDNIAFSHRRCNVPHNYRGNGEWRRKVGPEGTAWCRRCKAFLSVQQFSRNRTRWNGLQSWCNSCLKQHGK